MENTAVWYSVFGIFVAMLFICCICIKDTSPENSLSLFRLCIFSPVSNLVVRIREKIRVRGSANTNKQDVLLKSVDGHKYIKNICDEDKTSGDCPICCNELQQENERPVKISCDHAFHRKCIVKWLEESKLQCPICRREAQLLK